jgi:hypothetical protein
MNLPSIDAVLNLGGAAVGVMAGLGLGMPAGTMAAGAVASFASAGNPWQPLDAIQQVPGIEPTSTAAAHMFEASHGATTAAPPPPPPAQYPPGTTVVDSVAWIGGRGGCKNVKCAGIPLLLRKKHRTNCPNVGLHLGCCIGYPGLAGGIGTKVGKDKEGGHSPNCVTTSEAIAADEGGKIFGAAVPNQGVTGTTTANGRHVPEGWFQQFCDWVETIDGGLVEAAITEERQGDKKFKHLHWWLQGSIAERHCLELKAMLKAVWGIGNSPGQLPGKIMIKKATNRRGWLQYVFVLFSLFDDRCPWRSWLCLFVCLFVCLFTCLLVCLFVCLFAVCLFVCLLAVWFHYLALG